jgi:pimeloyl-ACP methyl ester carboxylesterase
MSIDHTVVLLPGLGDASAQTTAQRAALEQLAPVLTPDIAVSDTGPVILEDPALRVLATIIAADTDDAVLIGHGWGSMVALQIAATHSEQIAALMLSTNARLETIMIRSIFYGVLGLLPATVVQQLGGRPADVAALFDQVRPVDFKRLAEQIRAPALVVVGERDVANLRVVPQAGAGWQAQQPQLLAELLVDFLSGST